MRGTRHAQAACTTLVIDKGHTSPEGPAASAARKVRSPLPQQTSMTWLPGAAPLQLTAMRFHTRCCPKLSTSFICAGSHIIRYGVP